MIEINKPSAATYYLAKNEDGVFHIGITDIDQVTTTGMPEFVYSSNEIEFLQQTDAFEIEYNELPEAGEWVERGIYSHEGKLVICRQAHERTIYPPDETPALFAVYREDAEQVLEWIKFEEVKTGWRRKYNDVIYEVLQSHLTDFTPDLTPSLWKVVSLDEFPQWIQPTGAHDAYNLGDRVTHNEQNWESTINANTTEPEVTVFNWWTLLT